MKLYVAGNGPQNDGFETLVRAAGVRNRMVTFSEVFRDARKQALFWLEKRSELLRVWNESTQEEQAEFMKLYVAGNGKSKDSPQRDHATGVSNRLLSYAFLDDWAKEEFAFWVTGGVRDVSVFLDSGAFSAHTLGRVINLDEYCAYVHQHKHALAAYAVLDVIGDAEASLENLNIMRAKGLDPVAIYHVGSEPLSVLEQVLSDKSAYVALGGMASERPTREELQQVLDPCWRIIEKHWPVRVHGLGVMAQWALERYPWYSVDSSSAIVAAGMGRVARFRNGVMRADGWRDDIVRTMDGTVADGVGRVKKEGDRSASAHEGRRVRNIQAQLALERHVTDLWRKRGVSWTEAPRA